MEGASYVLGHKTLDGLLVRLTRTGKRMQWEYVEEFDKATTFASLAELEKKAEEHHCPRTCARVRTYESAFSAWLATTKKHPEE